MANVNTLHLSNLTKRASVAAATRGHDLRPWWYGDRGQASSTCRFCEAWAAVDSMPRPNGVDVAGTAVALQCPA